MVGSGTESGCWVTASMPPETQRKRARTVETTASKLSGCDGRSHWIIRSKSADRVLLLALLHRAEYRQPTDQEGRSQDRRAGTARAATRCARRGRSARSSCPTAAPARSRSRARPGRASRTPPDAHDQDPFLESHSQAVMDILLNSRSLLGPARCRTGRGSAWPCQSDHIGDLAPHIVDCITVHQPLHLAPCRGLKCSANAVGNPNISAVSRAQCAAACAACRGAHLDADPEPAVLEAAPPLGRDPVRRPQHRRHYVWRHHFRLSGLLERQIRRRLRRRRGRAETLPLCCRCV